MEYSDLEVDGSMRVHNNTIFMGDNTLNDRHNGGAQEKKNGNSIFAGDLNKKFDPIKKKRQDARKQAMKMVSDVWAGDRKIDEGIESSRNKIREYQNQKYEAEKGLKEIEDAQKALRDRYGITDEAKEQQDLLLLERKENAQKRGEDAESVFTPEEQERLAQLEADGFTEYREQSLDMKKEKERLTGEWQNAKDAIHAELVSISSTQIDRLKYHAMIDAQNAAEDIMEAASEEIVGMLVDEAKDHIDEEMEEKKEAAEEKAEKEEEEEEKIEDAREEKESRKEFAESSAEYAEYVTKALTQMDDTMGEVQREVKKLLEELKLLDEDLKGAAVDTSM